jgi:hypothetical protein
MGHYFAKFVQQKIARYVWTKFSQHISLLYPQRRADLGLIEADYDLTADIDNGYAHLAGLVYHLFPLVEVGGDIELRVRHAISLEE